MTLKEIAMAFHHPQLGSPFTGRSLSQFNQKFWHEAVETTIRKAMANPNRVRLLELGFGEGRVLMELRSQFPSVELHGVNRQRCSTLSDNESLLRTGAFYNLLSEHNTSYENLPKLYFCDAAKLPFTGEYFDLVISQVSFHYIVRKDRALEEIIRVLRVGGEALIHIDTIPVSGPDFFLGHTPRFLLYKHDKQVAVETFMTNRCGAVVEATFNWKEKCGGGFFVTLHLKKKCAALVNLGLVLDASSSFCFEDIAADHSKHVLYGYRSVFREVQIASESHRRINT